MPDFAASLLDGSGNVALSTDGTNITIGDYSNYIASTEVAHLQEFFEDFIRIIITNPDGTTYEYSSLGDGDATLNTPDGYSATPTQTLYDYQTNGNGDGVYKVTLRVCPTWDGKNTYASGHCVYYSPSGLFYKSNASTNTDTPGIGAKWDEIDEEDLTSKYQVYERIAITCDLAECRSDLVVSANCVELNMNCSDLELCENETFRAAARVSMIIDAVEVLAEREDWTMAQEAINSGKTICTCCL